MATSAPTLGLRDRSFNNPAPPRPSKIAGTKRKRPRELSAEEKAQKQKDKKEEEERKAKLSTRLLVSVDFGTTHFGVAYVVSTQTCKDVSVIPPRATTSRVPGNEDKAPSRIAYAVENHFRDGKDKFADEVESGMTVCQWFKLHLDGSTKATDFDDELLQTSIGRGLMHLPTGKDARQVTTDFLRYVYGRAMVELQQKFSKVAIEDTAIRFVVTCPASWVFASREATRQAALDAGFGKRRQDELVMIDEPEASSIAAFYSLESSIAESVFPKRSAFCVVDAGGGTVDLISYRILCHEPLKLEEACEGQGGKVGGTSIDRALHALMHERFGDAFAVLPIKKTGAKSPFMEAFEPVKRNWKGPGNGKDEYWLPLKMKTLDKDDESVKPHYDFEDDQVQITSDDLVLMFKEVLKVIFNLVKQQILRIKETQPKACRVETIVLCGGLGESPYVFEQFEQWIDRYFVKDKVKLVNPPGSWSSVSKGAVMRELLKNPVMYRRSRHHVGTVVHRKFNEEEHQLADRYWCPIMKHYRAKNQMQWILERGRRMSMNMNLKLECYATIDTTKDPYIYQDLYRCLVSEQVGRLGRSVEKIGRLRVDVSKLIKEDQKIFKRAKRDYPQFRPFEVDIYLNMTSTKGILEAVAKSGRRKLASTTIEYTPDPAWQTALIHDADDEDEAADSEEVADDDDDGGGGSGSGGGLDEEVEDEESDQDIFLPE